MSEPQEITRDASFEDTSIHQTEGSLSPTEGDDLAVIAQDDEDGVAQVDRLEEPGGERVHAIQGPLISTSSVSAVREGGRYHRRVMQLERMQEEERGLVSSPGLQLLEELRRLVSQS